MAAKASTSLSPNIASTLCYIPMVGFVAAIVFLIIEKNTTVRWNAIQSLLLGLGTFVLDLVLGMTVVLALLIPIVNIASLVVTLVLAVKAYQGSTVRLPLLGEWADKVSKKV